jgi:hypothetical protein
MAVEMEDWMIATKKWRLPRLFNAEKLLTGHPIIAT